MRSYFLPLILVSLLWAGCKKDDLVKNPPQEMINIPDFYNQENGFSAGAVKINNLNKVIGWIQESYRPGYRSFDQRFCAYIYDHNTKVTEQVIPENASGAWLFDINDANDAVGAYIHEDSTSIGVIYEDKQPFYAFLKTNAGILDLHHQGYDFSVASHITESGRIFGEVGNFIDGFFEQSFACEFFRDGREPKILTKDPIDKSEVQAVNDKYIILKNQVGFLSENSTHEIAVINLMNGSAFNLPISSDSVQWMEIRDINSNNIVVGSYINFDFRGFVFDISEREQIFFGDTVELPGGSYVWHHYFAINDQNTICGAGFRINNDFVLPQARALRVHIDFSGYQDITPDNDNAYAEAFDINEDGYIVGMMGIANNTTVINRAFITK